MEMTMKKTAIGLSLAALVLAVPPPKNAMPTATAW
jgi:hypothetical protein